MFEIFTFILGLTVGLLIAFAIRALKAPATQAEPHANEADWEGNLNRLTTVRVCR